MTIRDARRLIDWLARTENNDTTTILSMIHVALALAGLYLLPAGWDIGLFLLGMTTWIFWLAPVIRRRRQRQE